MLARTVDARVGLLVQEALEAVLLGDVAERVHHQHVVVGREVQLLELRRELELGRSDLVVTGLRRDAELPELLLDVVHEREDAIRNRAEVVIFELLALGGRSAEKRAAGEDEVRALLPVLLVDEEVFLLGAERATGVGLFLAEELHETLEGLVEGLHRTEKRCLLVERFTRISTERRRDAERRAVAVTLDEGGGGRIPGGVAAGLERGADAARREGRGVRLADDQVLARKRHDWLAILSRNESCFSAVEPGIGRNQCV